MHFYHLVFSTAVPDGCWKNNFGWVPRVILCWFLWVTLFGFPFQCRGLHLPLCSAVHRRVKDITSGPGNQIPKKLHLSKWLFSSHFHCPFLAGKKFITSQWILSLKHMAPGSSRGVQMLWFFFFFFQSREDCGEEKYEGKVFVYVLIDNQTEWVLIWKSRWNKFIIYLILTRWW